jgi:hypothetical protein
LEERGVCQLGSEGMEGAGLMGGRKYILELRPSLGLFLDSKTSTPFTISDKNNSSFSFSINGPRRQDSANSASARYRPDLLLEISLQDSVPVTTTRQSTSTNLLASDSKNRINIGKMPSFTVYRGSESGAIVKATTTREVGPDEVLVRVTHSGVCGTDEHHRHSGIVLGHEGTGVVEVHPTIPSVLCPN